MEAAGWQIHPLGGEFSQAGILAAETAGAGNTIGRAVRRASDDGKAGGSEGTRRLGKTYSGF